MEENKVNDQKLESIKEQTVLEQTVLEQTVSEQTVLEQTVLEPTVLKTNDSDVVNLSDINEKIELKPENILIDLCQHLYTYVKSVHSEKITPLNIVVITTELMQLVEKYNNLTGTQKKMLVFNVIKKLVNNQTYTPEERVALNVIIDFTLPSVVDNLVNAINGDLNFTKVITTSFFKKFFSCGSKTNKS